MNTSDRVIFSILTKGEPASGESPARLPMREKVKEESPTEAPVSSTYNAPPTALSFTLSAYIRNSTASSRAHSTGYFQRPGSPVVCHRIMPAASTKNGSQSSVLFLNRGS